MDLTPIKLKAPVKDYIWGGTRLISEFNKQTNLDKAAESWELSTHPNGQSIVSSGRFNGLTLSEYIEENGISSIGTHASAFDMFPILIKLIDAHDDLSIQVHPDNEYALREEGEYGKTEMWYIIDCEPDSYLYYGLNRAVTKKELKERIENNTLPEVLNKVSVHKGDVFFIPAGTIHAICSGILICEIQQNSNITYRVYDYDRRGSDGKPRDLHIMKAVEVSDLSPAVPQKKFADNTLAECKYFTVKEIICRDSVKIKVEPDSFRSLIVLEGDGMLEMNDSSLQIYKGDSIFIPAQHGNLVLNGNLKAILTYV